MAKKLPADKLTRSSMLARQINKDWWWTTIALVLFSLGLFFFKTETSLQRLDLAFYDSLSALAKAPLATAAKTNQTALIIIDDYSLEKMGYWPWRRSEYARVLDYLSLAKAVGIDIIFQDPNPMYPLDDQFLSYSIEQHGRVVLASTINTSQSHLHPPLTDLAEAATSLGYINIYPDSDGVVRHVRLLAEVDGQTATHFSLALLEAAGDSDTLDEVRSSPLGADRLIPFAGPAGSFEIFSFYDVLSGAVSPEVFKDRYVLIGAWGSGLGDYYPTPLSSESQTSMAGVEILANILESALNDDWIKTPPILIKMLLSALPVLFMCYVLRALPPLGSLIGTIAVSMWIFIGSWFLLRMLNIWIPPSAAIISTILAYPVWYWRSQETVIRYVNNELSEMRQQDPSLSQAIKNSSAMSSLPERLAHLHKAIELLREAQQRREETLRFISHDMRSPQNSILSLIKMQRNKELELDLDAILNQVESYSQTTLELVDDFMDLARVEAMELHFESTCLNDVVAEVCDEAWIRAKNKNIRLLFNEPDHTIWAPIAAKLFKRALANLLDNAIKYSPEDTTVYCRLALIDQTVEIQIQDQGWGIPAQALPTIFQAFKRAHASRVDGPAGSGLGLAFVHTVISRHFGTIEVSSVEGQGTLFTIEIPSEEVSM